MMGKSVDYERAKSLVSNSCPHCHATTTPQKRSRWSRISDLFQWALIFANAVILSLLMMQESDRSLTIEDNPDCWSAPRMPRIEFITLETLETPKEVLERDFPERAPLPIRGGWGYDLQTACIIEPPDDPEIPFDGVDVEYAFAAHRIYEELMFMRPIGDDGYGDISFQFLRQMVRREGDRYHDVVTFQVSARPLEWTAPVGNAKKGSRAPFHTCEREFWFDITSFYGS
jgi:hypothetical protein